MLPCTYKTSDEIKINIIVEISIIWEKPKEREPESAGVGGIFVVYQYLKTSNSIC